MPVFSHFGTITASDGWTRMAIAYTLLPYLSNDAHWPSQPHWTEWDVCSSDSCAPKEPCISCRCTLSPPGEYDWTTHARWLGLHCQKRLNRSWSCLGCTLLWPQFLLLPVICWETGVWLPALFNSDTLSCLQLFFWVPHTFVSFGCSAGAFFSYLL